MATDSPPPSDSPDDAALELPPADIEALLAQAEQFVREAADELGDQFNAEAPSRPIDLSRPVSPAIVEEQLDEVAALVARANAEASEWAAYGDASPPADSEAKAAADAAPGDENPGDVSQIANVVDAAETRDARAIAAPPVCDDAAHAIPDAAPAATTTAEAPAMAVAATLAPEALPEPLGMPADSPAPENSIEPSESPDTEVQAQVSGPAVEADAQPAPLPSGLPAWPILLLLALNAPFRRVGPRGRRMAGMVAIATLLTSGIVWLLPFLL